MKRVERWKLLKFLFKKMLKERKGEHEKEALQLNSTRNGALTRMDLHSKQVRLSSLIRSHSHLPATTYIRNE